MSPYSKTLFLVSLLFAIILIFSPQVSARELVEAAQTQGSVQEDKHRHSHGHWGHEHEHGHWGHGHGDHHRHHDGHGHGHGHDGKPGHDGAGEN